MELNSGVDTQDFCSLKTKWSKNERSIIHKVLKYIPNFALKF